MWKKSTLFIFFKASLIFSSDSEETVDERFDIYYNFQSCETSKFFFSTWHKKCYVQRKKIYPLKTQKYLASADLDELEK